MGLDLKDKKVAVLRSLDVDLRMFKEKEGQKSRDRRKLSRCE